MDFWLGQSLAALNPALFKSQLYMYLQNHWPKLLTIKVALMLGLEMWGRRRDGEKEKSISRQDIRAKQGRDREEYDGGSRSNRSLPRGRCASFWLENIPVTWLLPTLGRMPLLSGPLQSHHCQRHHHHSTYSVSGTTLSAFHVLFNWILSTILWDMCCYLICKMRKWCLLKSGNLPKNIQQSQNLIMGKVAATVENGVKLVDIQYLDIHSILPSYKELVIWAWLTPL